MAYENEYAHIYSIKIDILNFKVFMANEIESKSAKETEKSKTLDKLEDNSKYDYITVPPDGGFS